MSVCHGNADDHCCWLQGAVCPHLEEHTVPGRRWACGLLRRLGDWESVIASDAYRQDVAPALEPLGYTCRDWPQNYPGMVCRTCGFG